MQNRRAIFCLSAWAENGNRRKTVLANDPAEHNSIQDLRSVQAKRPYTHLVREIKIELCINLWPEPQCVSMPGVVGDSWFPWPERQIYLWNRRGDLCYRIVEFVWQTHVTWVALLLLRFACTDRDTEPGKQRGTLFASEIAFQWK